MGNHDNLILKIFINKTGNFNSNKTRKINKYPNIKEYLDKRYNDSFSLAETLNRIKFHIDKHPKCPVCGNYVKYAGVSNNKIYFKETCSLSCGNKYAKDKREKTCLEKYGVKNGGGSKQALEKIKQTCLEKYGVDHVWKSKEIHKKCTETVEKRYGVTSTFALESSKQNMLSKYGVTNIMELKSTREKIKQTCLEKYGVDHAWKNENVRKKCLETFKENTGYNSPIQIPGISQKVFEIRKKNHTLNTSKIEEQLYKDIYSLFPSVKREYKELRYPWHCDFYIPELDMFIELQGYYTHGKHPYNPNSIEDLNLVKEHINKYGDNCPLVNVWTISDPKKRETAKKNNLNYVELFNKEDINLFLINLQNIKDEKFK